MRGAFVTAVEIAPGPKGLPLLGVSHRIRRETILDFFGEQFATYGHSVFLPSVGRNFMLTRDPAAFQYVFKDNPTNFVRSEIYDRLKPVFGDSLLTTDGAFWRRQRRMSQPAFARQILSTMVPAVVESVESLISRLDTHQGEVLAANKAFTGYTTEVACRVMFGSDVNPELIETLHRSIPILQRIVSTTFWEAISLPSWVPTPDRVRLRSLLQELDDIVLAFIAQRRDKPSERRDLLSLLITATDDETKSQMTDRQLRDEVITFFLAGVETTSTTLGWSTYLLSHHSAHCESLLNEAKRLDLSSFSLDDMKEMPETTKVIQESMRLYPPAFFISRRVVQDDVVAGFHVAEGTNILLSIFNLHRHPDLWPEPECFQPDRFTDFGLTDSLERGFIPFSAGQHRCIGASLAMLEGVLGLASVVKNFRILAAASDDPKLDPMITLASKHPLNIRLQGRG